ncbi:PHD finger domain-containing protein [Vibrio owensii]|uniref:PHD finger domain-containing protein n=1 Tax=Vibrio owensii TaxID=696485 RepID=UPI003395ABDC
MDSSKFAKIAESLRQYRRAELKDFAKEIGELPVEQLYVDPLPSDAVLHSVMSSNTTFLMGRKGTGKSTVFAKAQSEMRKSNDCISIYIDVKAINETLTQTSPSTNNFAEHGISEAAFRAHILRKLMLGKVISELLKEVEKSCDRMSLWDRWTSRKRSYDKLIQNLKQLEAEVQNASLESHEVPILQKITTQLTDKSCSENAVTASGKVGVKASATPSMGLDASITDFDKTLNDNEIYNEYSDVVLKSFPFNSIIQEIQSLVEEAGLLRLVAFFDDFSELKFVEQRLFVDVILSPLNNASNETIKLKVAAYPGRIYYGKIDPGKVDTIGLDFSDLYESTEVQEMERSATSYTTRLLETRFDKFGVNLADFFDYSSEEGQSALMKLMFQASFNVPRIMGHLLHILFLDRVSKGYKVNAASIRLASRKYYENTISTYFDNLNRFALEPFENKLDRHNQHELLGCLVSDASTTRKKILAGSLGGNYFSKLTSPPTSHFMLTPELEDVLSSLESNFFVSRYKEMRDKNGKNVVVYALFLGLCEHERMSWGYPEGREYRHYFQQRCFDYTRTVHHFLSQKQTIRCNTCEHCHPMELKPSIELFKWRCPECMEGTCAIVNLADDFHEKFSKLDKSIMLEPVELEILSVLRNDNRKMRAGEISALIDTTHQLVGRRTSKLQELKLVDKEDDTSGIRRSSITERARETYFGE